ARRRVTRFQRLGTGITVTNSPSPGALSSQCRLSGSEAIVVAKMVISLRWQPLQRDQLVVITTTERLSISDRSNARQLQKEKEELQKKQGRATAPKAVDEDLYKIPPELRRQKPKRVFITLTRSEISLGQNLGVHVTVCRRGCSRICGQDVWDSTGVASEDGCEGAFPSHRMRKSFSTERDRSMNP
ncbi:hypothetical protein BHE74_00010684, partial [Ensete ventricosum]